MIISKFLERNINSGREGYTFPFTDKLLFNNIEISFYRNSNIGGHYNVYVLQLKKGNHDTDMKKIDVEVIERKDKIIIIGKDLKMFLYPKISLGYKIKKLK